jgi:pimeloyl-ACP methyl ester carboxylesterase
VAGAAAHQRVWVGHVGHFDSVQQAADAMWAMSTSFGPHTPEQWLALSQAMVRPSPQGGFTLHYDPAIAVPFRTVTQERPNRARRRSGSFTTPCPCETLLLRGALSDLLSRQTAEAMTRRGPKARLVEIEGVGHAPTLIAQEQIDVVASFLLNP